MASSLVTRICDPWQLTEEQKAEARTELGITDDDMKVPYDVALAIVSETVKGRDVSLLISSSLTAQEQVDAQGVISRVLSGQLGLEEVRYLLVLGERRVYPLALIDQLLGINP